MAAWVSKEVLNPQALDARGKPKRRRQICPAGVKGVGAVDRFIVEWLSPAGKRCREKIAVPGKPGKKLADDRCNQINSQLTLGTYQDKDRGTWAAAKANYIRDELPRKRSDFTKREIKKTLDRFEAIVTPVRLRDVDAAMVARFTATRLAQKNRNGEPLSHATINLDLRTLKSFLRTLHDWKDLREVPKIKMLEETEREKPIYTEAEFKAMFDSCGVAKLPHGEHTGGCPQGLWWQALIMLFWETGTRKGELLSLRWSEVDLDRGFIMVNPANTKSKRLKRHGFYDSSRRLLASLAAYGTDGNVFKWPHELCLLNKVLDKIQAAAGINRDRKELKFHAFRRTCGNIVAELYGLNAAQQKLGHSSPTITAKHYAQAAMKSLAAKAIMPIPEGLRIVG